MTWNEFKKYMELLGIKEEDKIRYIDFNTPTPFDDDEPLSEKYFKITREKDGLITITDK